MNKDNKKLDLYQEKIVKEEKSFLAIAGAGCGKTFTIIKKIEYYLEKGYDIDRFLVITYTKLSALEISERLLKKGIILKVQTFHSLAYTVVDKAIISKADIKYLKVVFIQENLLRFNKLSGKLNKKPNNIIDEFQNLVDVMKVNEENIKVFKRKALVNKDYYSLFKEYYTYYEQFLAKQNMIDFNDLIRLARGKILANYQYIFIDEFQDISYTRYMLVEDIVRRNNAKLYCFGDDYQAIYQFSGSKLDYFVDFKELSGINNVLYILKTYRNSQELLDIATTFIQKNKRQIHKKLYSDKTMEYPLVVLYYEYKKAFDYIFQDINNAKEVLILSRYSYAEDIVKKHFEYTNGNYWYKNYNNPIKFLTVHKSKGLESDNVIVLEMINSNNGFPSKKTKILPKQTYFSYPYAEERRLFYVAITRTKNKCYLITRHEKESDFINEIKHYKHVLTIY